jgi:hypothetical protein
MLVAMVCHENWGVGIAKLEGPSCRGDKPKAPDTLGPFKSNALVFGEVFGENGGMMADGIGFWEVAGGFRLAREGRQADGEGWVAGGWLASVQAKAEKMPKGRSENGHARSHERSQSWNARFC